MEQVARRPICVLGALRLLLPFLVILEASCFSHVVKLAPRLSVKDYCSGEEAIARISPVDAGVSLGLYTPTFHVPENRGCSVLPMGIAVKEVESVTYELGSVEVQTSAIFPIAETAAGGFNLSFAANQTLQIKPADVMLPAKEDAGYTLQCTCPPVVQPVQAAVESVPSIVSTAIVDAALVREGTTAQISPALQTAVPSAQVTQTLAVDSKVETDRAASPIFLAPEKTAEQLTLDLKEMSLRTWGERQPTAGRPAVADSGATIGEASGAMAHAVALPATGRVKVQQGAIAGEADAVVGGVGATSAASTANAAVLGSASASQGSAAKSEQLPQTWEGWFWAFLRGFSIASAVKMACMASNVVFQVSPLPQVRSWSKASSTGDMDAAPYMAVCVGGWQWCYYGVFAWLVTGRDGFLILVHSNVLGAVLGTYYVGTFWQNCASRYALQDFIKYLKMACILAVCEMVVMASLSVQWSLLLAGITASLCSVLTSLALLVSVPKVIATRNSAAIPAPIVFAGLVSSTCWFCCGTMLGDRCILFPNGVFIGVAVLCLSLKWRYPSLDDCDGLKEEADFDDARCPSGGTGSTS